MRCTVFQLKKSILAIFFRIVDDHSGLLLPLPITDTLHKAKRVVKTYDGKLK